MKPSVCYIKKGALSLFLSFLLLQHTSAQNNVPTDKMLSKIRVKPDSYKMMMYVIRDTNRREFGESLVTIENKDGKVFVTQDTKVYNMPSKWIDSTVALSKGLAPVYHSSMNMQRDMNLQFGSAIVKGSYNDKMKKKTTGIEDTVSGKYFDSNLYPFLISWLPLEEGYTATVPIYDYSSTDKHGITKVTITDVRKTSIPFNGGSINVFEVTVQNISNNISKYYVGVKDKRIYRIDSKSGGGSMQMLRVN